MFTNKMIRRIALICVLALVLACTAGCSKDKGGKTSGKTEDTSSESSSGISGNAFLSGGGASSHPTLNGINNVLYGAKPTLKWKGLKSGQTLHLVLKDANGKTVVEEKAVKGDSYTLKKALSNGATYYLQISYKDSSGKEKRIPGTEDKGKELRCITKSTAADGKNYKFDGSISFDVVNNYLDRAVTYNIGVNDTLMEESIDEAARFLTNVGAKYVQRAAGEWQPSKAVESKFPAVREKLDLIHSVDPDIVFEAAVFETIFTDVNNIKIPEWVFKDFGLKVEDRNFDYNKCLFENGYGINEMGGNTSIPDITRTETQMFVYYRACGYIDAGFEALHLGQVKLTGRNDGGYACWTKVVNLIRAYAKKHARRHYVLINAHDYQFIDAKSGKDKMLADFIMAPIRVHAASGEKKHAPTEDNPQKCIVEPGYWGTDSIYQLGIKGTSPSGWHADKYPYIVEFDNYGDSIPGGEASINDPKAYCWGFDEITWFCNQPQWYRQEFMDTITTKIHDYKENGHVCLVGHRGGYYSVKEGKSVTYYANNKSVHCVDGHNDEEAIKKVFAK